MRDPDAVIEPAFYDHEHDGTRERERRAEDWGADAVFASHPRRRFERRPDHGVEPRRFEAARRSRSQLDAASLSDGIEWMPPAPAEAAPAEPTPIEPAATDHPPAARAPDGRRTVVVTGRPGGAAPRRRPPQRPQDRLSARPDRVAGWAFGLGLLLIAVAAAPV